MLLKLSTLQVRQQLYERSTRRFVLRSRREARQDLMIRAGQCKLDDDTASFRRTNILPSHPSSPVHHRLLSPAKDNLESLERFCRCAGRREGSNAVLNANGSMRMEGAFAEIKPIFAVDENNREIRFASTGGAVDRLHMSDGVVWIVPKSPKAPHFATAAWSRYFSGHPSEFPSPKSARSRHSSRPCPRGRSSSFWRRRRGRASFPSFKGPSSRRTRT